MSIVHELQHALLARGISVGKFGADGIMGTDTWVGVDAAVRRLPLETILAAIETLPVPSVGGSLLTEAVIRKVCPGARADLVQAIVDGAGAIAAAGITTRLRAAHFLAQIATETGGLKAIEENLNYSAKRMMQVWPSRFPTLASAQPYANKPQALANKVYGGRLGNTGPDDGWRYRGGGMLQTTGRENYRRAGFEDDSDALRQPGPALAAALTFWTGNGLNALADRDDLTAVRKRINGGTNGLAEARAYLGKAKAALGA
jgi:putative chitinase